MPNNENLKTFIDIEALRVYKEKEDAVIANTVLQETTRATGAESSLRTDLNNHISNQNNPHVVTKDQVGLSNVDNTSDINKPISNAQAVENSRLEGLINAEASTRESEDNAIKADITALQNRSTDIEGDITALDSRVTTNEGNISTLQSSINKEVVNDAAFTYNSETGKSYITQTKINISTGSNNTSATEVPLATSTQPGLMSKEQVGTLSTALQSSDITTGSSDGSIAVKGTDVPVKGLTETAFTEKSFFAEDSKVLHNDRDEALDGGLSITGDVVISGNLSVTGTTTTTDAETLAVHDNLIITNSDNTPLTNNSGLAIKTGATGSPNEAYAIVFDPTSTVGGSVKLGLGTINSDNEFTFDDGSGEPIATRADSSDPSMTDKVLMEWDAPNHRLVGSGITASGISTDISNLQTDLGTANTNIANNTTAIGNNASAINTINSKIPSEASESNKLATENYVATNGGKIDAIQVNGTTQTITNKVVDIIVPTKTSDLTNDSSFVDQSSLNTTLANYALDNSVVKLTGDQSVAGVKTFSNSPAIEGNGASISLKDTNSVAGVKSTVKAPLLGEGDNTDKTLYLPNKNGTLATTDDIPKFSIVELEYNPTSANGNYWKFYAQIPGDLAVGDTNKEKVINYLVSNNYTSRDKLFPVYSTPYYSFSDNINYTDKIDNIIGLFAGGDTPTDWILFALVKRKSTQKVIILGNKYSLFTNDEGELKMVEPKVNNIYTLVS